HLASSTMLSHSSLHYALPISQHAQIDHGGGHRARQDEMAPCVAVCPAEEGGTESTRDKAQLYGDGEPDAPGVAQGKPAGQLRQQDRKSTRLNSSHVKISYADI